MNMVHEIQSTSLFHMGFACGSASGCQGTHTPQFSRIHMIPIKTQQHFFSNLNSFSLKTKYNVASVEYLTVSGSQVQALSIHQGFQSENSICCSSSIQFLNSCPTNLVTCPEASRSLIQMPPVTRLCHLG